MEARSVPNNSHMILKVFLFWRPVNCTIGGDLCPKLYYFIEKGLITEAEFMEKLSAERAVYRAVLQNIR